MKLQNWLMAFILVSLFLVAGLFMLGDISKNYGEFGADMHEADVNNSFNKTINSINKMYNTSQDIDDLVVGAELGDETPSEASFKGAFSAVRNVRNVWDIFGNLIQETATVLHIPVFFLQFLIAAATLAVLFAIISVILRFRE